MSVRSFTLSVPVLAVLWLWPAAALAQVEQWQSHMDAGVKAYLQLNYPEAEKQFTAAANEAEQLDPEHPRLGTALNSLAETHRAQGRFEEAESLHKRALAIREKALGPEHPDVATSLHNLALVYHGQGRYAEAEPLYKRSLAIQEKMLGPEHPDVVRGLENYANLLRKVGRRVAEKKTHRLVGAHILAPEGADSIQTAALAIKHGMTTRDLAETIFPYLTTVEGLKLAALSFEQDVAMLSCCAG